MAAGDPERDDEPEVAGVRNAPSTPRVTRLYGAVDLEEAYPSTIVDSRNSGSVGDAEPRITQYTKAITAPSPVVGSYLERYRIGDIRHCFADITLARTVLGYEPKVSFDQGMQELAGWLEGQIAVNRVGEASSELVSRGLTV